MAVALLALSPSLASAQDYVAGRVVESGVAEPVVGAVVVLDGSISVVTGAEGEFRFGPVATGEHELTVTHLAYGERTLRVRATTPVTVELTPRPLDLDAMVVSASRREQALADVPVTTELVSRAEIERSGAADVSGVLIERTGIDLQGGHPAGSGVMLQGLGSERVLVLLDGQPYVGRIAGVTDVSRIPSSMIERIEVVKGPQSTLHGSEAMGGVINIVTRRPEAHGLELGANVMTGDRGRMDVSGRSMLGLGAMRVMGELGHRSIELTPGQAENTGALASRWDGLARAEWTPREGLTTEIAVLGLDERQRWRSGQLWNFADNRQWALRTAAQWQTGAHRLAPTLYATGFDHLSRRATGPEPVEGSGDEETQRLFEAELLYGLTLGSLHFDVGTEAKLETIRSGRVVGGERDHSALEAFAQPTLEWNALTIVPGLRASHSNAWGTHLTPRLALLYRPLEPLAIRVSLGEGFRAPDFKELHMQFVNTGAGPGYVVRGNPDLEPELSRNATLGVEWNGALAYARVQGFQTRFERFIETVALADSAGLVVYSYGNVDDGRTEGLELETGVNHGPWRLELGGALLRAEHEESGEPLLGRPRDSMRASLGWAHPIGLRISASGVRTGRTAMSREEGSTQWRDAYTRFDLRLAQELPGGLQLVAGADNVLDATVDEWPGFSGRHIYLGMSWQAMTDSFGENE